MKILAFSITALATIIIIVILNTTLLLPAPIGKLLSPQHGLWQNAEPVDKNFSESLVFTGLKGKVNVYFDERLVPHVFAEQENDAWFVQGYLHAKFRLWQMELQTFAEHYLDKKIVRERWNEWLEFERNIMLNLDVRGDRIH